MLIGADLLREVVTLRTALLQERSGTRKAAEDVARKATETAEQAATDVQPSRAPIYKRARWKGHSSRRETKCGRHCF